MTGHWGSGFHAFVITANLDADLLCADSWKITNKLAYNPATQPPIIQAFNSGWLEGNVVRALNGQIWNLLRVQSPPVANIIAKCILSEDRSTLTFDPKSGFLEFPGGMTKFTIRFDPITKRYWTLSNEVLDDKNPWQRNHLILASSADLLHWVKDQVLLYENEVDSFGIRLVKKIIPIQSKLNQGLFRKKIGFQYVDWQFDGPDLIFVVRTAFNGAHNFHDSNYITFFRISDFRKFFSQA